MKNMAEENPGRLEDRDTRRFHRWEVSIPCTVEWGDTIARGQIANLSYGGALITKVDAVPPEGAPFIVSFQVEKEKVELEGKLVHTINHSFSGPLIVLVGAMEDGQIGAFGVEFQGSPEEVRSKLVPVFRDLTHRKRMEEKLHRINESYYDLFDNAPDMMAIIEFPSGEVLECNQTLVDAVGHSKENIVGRPWLDLYHPKFEAVAKETFDSFANTDRIVRQERDLLRADGSVIPVLVHARAIRDEGGKVVATEVTWRDITEYKQLEEQLLQAQKMETIGRLAGGIAHDFNNILTGIIGYSQFSLLKVESDSQIGRDLLGVLALADRAQGLTRQLLVFSRKQRLEPVVLNLNQAVENVLKVLHGLIREDINLKLVPAPDSGNVKADPSQIEQVLMNLMLNAQDAMPGGGTLNIQTANVDFDQTYAQEQFEVEAGSYVMLAVTDTGYGMDRETQKRAFEPFFTTKEKEKGTGLGLSTVYGIVKQHGGHIWVSTQPGEGTTFKIYLPRVDEKAQPLPIKAKEETLPEGSETILVAEDETAIGEIVQRILEGLGYRVFITDGAEEAEKVFSQHSDKIDLLLADIVMPGLGGPELYERLVAKRPSLKVLYMTGYSDVAILRNHALEESASYIDKPFTATSLAPKVREVLDSREVEGGQQELDQTSAGTCKAPGGHATDFNSFACGVRNIVIPIL